MRIISDEEFKEVFVAENIMGRLINKNVDREWLSGIPHRTFLDMYIIYQVDISVLFNQPDYVQIAIIDYDVANMMSMREDDLYLAALTNGNRDAYVANIKEFIGLIRKLLRKRRTHLPHETIFWQNDSEYRWKDRPISLLTKKRFSIKDGTTGRCLARWEPTCHRETTSAHSRSCFLWEAGVLVLRPEITFRRLH